MNKIMEDKIMMIGRKIGIDEKMIDEDMVWAMKKIMVGASRMAKIMTDKGMVENEVMEIMKKMSSLMLDKEMMMEMAEMDEKKW